MTSEQSPWWRRIGWAAGRAVLDLLFPPRCLICRAESAESPDGVYICRQCRERLFPADWQACPRCAAPVQADREAVTHCPFCRRLPRSLDGVTALGRYEGPLREVILRMKQRRYIPLTQAMARLFARQMQPIVAPWQPSLVTPTPMHWRRRWVRGVNSPEMLAAALGRAVGVPVADRLMIPRRRTRLQTELSPTARKTNVQGAFRVRAGAQVQGARVLLVDDVLTTGATAGEIAKMLKQAGASAVWAAVLARTPPRTSR